MKAPHFNSFRAILRWAGVALLLVCLATLISDCDEGSETSTPAVHPVVAAGTAMVQGTIQFQGPKPVMQIIGGNCCPGAAPVSDESAIVNNNGTLKNVVVYIKDGPNVALSDTSQPVLDQKNCQYLPHVLALHVGQPLLITSHDPVMHNVNVQATINPPQNFSQTAVGASRQVSFTKPEFVHVKCDVHPWMSAYVAVFDHPFYAITHDDGAFTLDRLPAGSYTLVAWHERYGSIEQPITVAPRQHLSVTLTYK